MEIVTLEMSPDGDIGLTNEEGAVASIPASFIVENELFDEYRDSFKSYEVECDVVQVLLLALLRSKGMTVRGDLFPALYKMCVPGPAFDYDPADFQFGLIPIREVH